MYLVVNASFAYNMMLGRLTLNRLGAVPSTRHMKMKLPNLTGRVITIKSDKKETKRCYKNNLKTRRGVSMVASGPPYTEEIPLPKVSRAKPDRTMAKIAHRTKSDPFGNPGEREIGEKDSNLSDIPGQTTQNLVEKIVESRLKPRYPVMIDQAIGSAFGQKQNQFQSLTHRGSRVCQGSEERHQVLEKAVPLVSCPVSPVWTNSFRKTEILESKHADLRR